MYIISISLFCFFLSFLKENDFLTKVIDVLFIFFIPFLLLRVYFGGEDWINYYNIYLQGSILSNPLDLFFSMLIKTIYFFSFNNFAITIYIYYIVCFALLKNLFLINNSFLGGRRSYYFFISLVLFTLGPGLVLEQLRQFLSVIMLLYFITFIYSEKHKYIALFFMFAALLSHSSSFLFVFIAIFLPYLNNKKSVINLICVVAVISILSIEFLSSSFVNNLPILSILSNKLLEYKMLVGGGGAGIVYLLCAFSFVFFFLFFDESKNSRFENNMVILFLFSLFIFFFSLFFPFVTRFLSSGIVIYILYLSLKYNKIKFSSVKVNVFSLFCSLFLIVISLSYYRNIQAPFNFLSISNHKYTIPLTENELLIRKSVIEKDLINIHSR
ncbi:TPA: EpsG family protein [Photobacterium damselae]